MKPEDYARVKQLFLEALELSGDARRQFLDEQCGGDEAMRREVESLLRHHSPETLIERPLADTREISPLPSGAGGLQPRRLGRPFKTLAGKWAAMLNSPWRRHIAVVVPLLILVLLGLWTRYRVKEALRRINQQHLEVILAADVGSLKLWIEERIAEAHLWAAEPGLRESVIELARIGNDGTPEAINRLQGSQAHQHLEELLARYLEGAEDSFFLSVCDEQGYLLFNRHRALTGRRLNKEGMAYLTRVFAGETVFVRPIREHELTTDDPAQVDLQTEAHTWVATPIADDTGRAVASLNLAKEADERFSEILGLAKIGESGESYVFDAQGRMLSESARSELLRQAGLLDEQQSSMFHVRIRDPGVDLALGRRPSQRPEQWPQTKLAEAALGAPAGVERGTLTSPYRNYRGADVIGAWQWLPEHQLCMAVEVEAREAFAPLRALNLILGVLLGSLAAALGWAVYSGHAVLRLRDEIGQVRRLGQYTLIEKLGEGGMGIVYLARHALLKRPTAVKLLKPERNSQQAVARFQREVQLASQLAHPNTIEIYDFGHTEDGRFFYAMEYLDGWTLARLVQECGPQPPGRVIDLLCQICRSLREAHETGLVHRDIKPLNLMLCARGAEYDVIKVLDFGLVKSLDPEAVKISSQAEVSGTPLYMSPERMRAGAVDARSDLYSVGAVAYYLLSGKSIFDTLSDIDTMYKVLRQKPRPLEEVTAQPLPDELSRLVMQCLEKSPNDRPASAAEMLERLEAIEGVVPWQREDAEAWWAANPPPRQFDPARLSQLMEAAELAPAAAVEVSCN